MIRWIIVFVLLYSDDCQGMRRINIEREELIDGIQQKREQDEYLIKAINSYSPPVDSLGSLSIADIYAINHEQSQNSQTEAVTTAISTKKPKKRRKVKKRKLKKVKVKPRGGKHIKETYQRLRPWNTQLLEAREYAERLAEQEAMQNQTIVTFEPIYDENSGKTYSQDDLSTMCEETKKIGKQYGISDISSFAGNNCFLIRIYYGQVTCEQINMFIKYCQTTGRLD